MSKADPAFSTPASASKSRRAVILGAGGLAAAGALSAAAKALPATAGLDHQTLIAEIRRLHAKHQDLITHEMSIEVPQGDPMRPTYEAAIAASEDACDELHGFCYRILEQPVRSWDDVVVRAELAQTFAEHEIEGGLSIVENPSDIGDETLAALLEAALLMGGNRIEPKPEPEVPAGSVAKPSNRPYAAKREEYWTDYDIVWAGLLIGHFRGTHKAAAYFDVPEAVILGWIRTDYIPPAWHAKVYAILEETGQTIAPHILGLAEDALPRLSGGEGGVHV